MTSPPAKSVAAFAPGRVNLIGEHTDYNDGLCLPFAIEAGVTVAAAPTAGDELVVLAADLGEEDRFPLAAPPPAPGWRAYVRGAAAELARAGVELRPARLEIAADLPRGAGLSSSAALTVATCLALCAAAGAAAPARLELARLCSRVEHDWVGAPTGLLDQIAALFGREGRAVRIDMQSLDIEPVPLELGEATLATLDSGAPRELASSGYAQRRAECEEAARALEISSLREVRAGQLELLPEPLMRRARHVLGENERVDAMVSALGARDLERAGSLLDASHASLRDDYEASVPAVERTVGEAKEAGALGARMVGGGFGGHVLALFGPGCDPPPRARVVRPGAAARLL